MNSTILNVVMYAVGGYLLWIFFKKVLLMKIARYFSERGIQKIENLLSKSAEQELIHGTPIMSPEDRKDLELALQRMKDSLLMADRALKRQNQNNDQAEQEK